MSFEPPSNSPGDVFSPEDVQHILQDFEMAQDFLMEYFLLHGGLDGDILSIELKKMKPLTSDLIANFMEDFNGSVILAQQHLSIQGQSIRQMQTQSLSRFAKLLHHVEDVHSTELLLRTLDNQEQNRQTVLAKYSQYDPRKSNCQTIIQTPLLAIPLKEALEKWNHTREHWERKVQLEAMCYKTLNYLKNINEKNQAQVLAWRPSDMGSNLDSVP